MFDATEFVEVTILSESSEEYRLPATIRHSDGQHLLISVEPKEVSLLVPGAQVQLMQVVDGSLYQCSSTIVNRRDNLFVTKIGIPQLLQRRRNKRYDCAMPVKYRLNTLLEEMQSAPDTDCKIGIVQELSLGGAKMAVKMALCEDLPLAIRIPLNEKEIIHAEGNVMRCVTLKAPVQNPDGPLEFAVALRFGSMPRINLVQLHRFLLQLA